MFDARPEAFGPYRVLDEIAAGRFGPIYRAQDAASGAPVAVKVFAQGLTAEQRAALARALSRLCEAPLDHPSILAPLEAGMADGVPWLAESYVPGMPLDRVLRRDGPQPLADVLLRITQIAGAIDFAAAVGVHHGSLHPHNVLVTDDTTALTDLGIVQALLEAGIEMPLDGACASPQRALGLPPTARDDIYALAAITCQLVYGVAGAARAAAGAATAALPGVDEARFRDVIEGTLSDDPADRPSTALEFAAALQRVIVDRVESAEAVRARPAGEPVPSEPSMRADDAAAEAPAVLELPLRAPEADFEPVVAEPAPVAPAVPQADPRRLERQPVPSPVERGDVRWLATAAALAIGLLAGFGAGYVAGQRDVPLFPRSAERPVARTTGDASNEATGTTSDDREYTESDIAGEPRANGSAPERVEDREVLPTEPRLPAGAPVPAPGGAAPPAGGGRAPSATGVLQIDSRPRGAQVFVDGRLAGRTPLSLPDVPSGLHAVRIHMVGYQEWTTKVQVAPGDRVRVAASLEQ